MLVEARLLAPEEPSKSGCPRIVVSEAVHFRALMLGFNAEERSVELHEKKVGDPPSDRRQTLVF